MASPVCGNSAQKVFMFLLSAIKIGESSGPFTTFWPFYTVHEVQTGTVTLVPSFAIFSFWKQPWTACLSDVSIKYGMV